jgi:hypothetical protein
MNRLNPSAWGHLKPQLCCDVGGFSAWGFKFLPYDVKFCSEGHYFHNFEGILMKLSQNIHYTLMFI